MKGKNAGLKRLWAPWRMKYIEEVEHSEEKGCIFCGKPGQHNDRKNYILYRAQTCIIKTFADNFGTSDYRHKVGIAIPSRYNMHMDVIVYSGSLQFCAPDEKE